VTMQQRHRARLQKRRQQRRRLIALGQGKALTAAEP
jgi:hypothetical protein